MSKGLIAAIVAGTLLGGLILGALGTAATVWVAGAFGRDRGAIYGRSLPDDSGRFGGQGAGRGGMMGRSPQGGPQRGQDMMGRRGAGLQGAQRYGDPDGAGPLVCPQCGETVSGTVAPGWLRR